MGKKVVGSVLPQIGEGSGVIVRSELVSVPNTVRDILTDSEAAQFLSIKERTLRLWRARRGLPHFKITHKEIRYRRADLERWLDGFRVATIG